MRNFLPSLQYLNFLLSCFRARMSARTTIAVISFLLSSPASPFHGGLDFIKLSSFPLAQFHTFISVMHSLRRCDVHRYIKKCVKEAPIPALPPWLPRLPYRGGAEGRGKRGFQKIPHPQRSQLLTALIISWHAHTPSLLHARRRRAGRNVHNAIKVLKRANFSPSLKLFHHITVWFSYTDKHSS